MRLLLALQPHWMRDAACTEHPDLPWFPNRGDNIRPCVEVCSRCLVLDECRAYAIADPSVLGVWAGTTERQRRQLRQEARS